MTAKGLLRGEERSGHRDMLRCVQGAARRRGLELSAKGGGSGRKLGQRGRQQRPHPTYIFILFLFMYSLTGATFFQALFYFFHCSPSRVQSLINLQWIWKGLNSSSVRVELVMRRKEASDLFHVCSSFGLSAAFLSDPCLLGPYQPSPALPQFCNPKRMCSSTYDGPKSWKPTRLTNPGNEKRPMSWTVYISKGGGGGAAGPQQSG